MTAVSRSHSVTDQVRGRRRRRPSAPCPVPGPHAGPHGQRQAVLARDKPPMLWVILDEGVLRRPAGGPKVVHEQLQHLSKTWT